MQFKNYIILSIILFLGCDSGTNSNNSSNISTVPPDGMKLISSNGASFDIGQIGVQVPVHPVTFSYDFFMDSTEITQIDYEIIMSDTVFGYKIYKTPTWDTIKGIGSLFPAYKVNWFDAALYCNARSKRDGMDTVYQYDSIIVEKNSIYLIEPIIDYSKKGYRLPTEAEWEFACRAGTTTNNYWGNDTIDNYEWYSGNSNNKAHEVAKKTPNNFGLYDMGGNLYEWCNNWINVYIAEEQLNPQGANTWYPYKYRVLRGQYYGEDKLMFSSARRYGMSPNYVASYFGFRCVLNKEIPQSWF